MPEGLGGTTPRHEDNEITQKREEVRWTHCLRLLRLAVSPLECSHHHCREALAVVRVLASASAGVRARRHRRHLLRHCSVVVAWLLRIRRLALVQDIGDESMKAVPTMHCRKSGGALRLQWIRLRPLAQPCSPSPCGGIPFAISQMPQVLPPVRRLAELESRPFPP